MRTRLNYAAVALISVSSQVLGQSSCETPEIWQTSTAKQGVYAVAQVVRDESGNEPIGSATVIDRRRGLLLTARHVIDSSGTVYFRFPHLGGKVLRGTVAYQLEKLNDDDEVSGASWARARDIAVIRADAPFPSIVKELQLRSSSRLLEKVTFFGFPSKTQTPSSGTGSWGVPNPPAGPISSAQAACTRYIREMTIGGDSGAAIISNGFVIGVASSSPSTGGMLFIPAGCFFDALATGLSDDPSGRAAVDRAYAALKDSPPEVLAAQLADDPASSEIGNLDLYLAAKRLLAEGRTISACPVLDIAYQRGLPLEAFARLVRTNEQKIAVANALLSAAQLGGMAVNAERLQQAALSVELFNDVIGQRVSDAFGMSEASLSGRFSADEARVLKATADANIMLVRSGGEALSLSAYAAKVAALAVVSADTPKLRGAALATLGQASQIANDPVLAAKAFTAAREEGFTPPWTVKRLRRSREELGGIAFQPLVGSDLVAVISK